MKCSRYIRRWKAACLRLKRKVASRQKELEARLESKRLKRQVKNAQIPYTHCKNCGTELQGVYCHRCGQYARDLKQSFGSYLMEYLSNTYNLDGKIFQTIGMLFRKPGFLTNEFLQGKINSYVHPLKLNMFLLLVVMTVFALSVSTGKSVKAEVDSYNEMEYPDLIMERLNSLDGYATELGKARVPIRLIAPYKTVKNNPATFEIIRTLSAEEAWNPDTMLVSASQWLIDEKLLVKADAEHYTFTDNKSIFNDKSKEGQLVREKFLSFFQSYLPMLIILMSPVLALILMLLNIQKKHPFMTHFIFSLHYSAFLEFLMLILLAVTNLFNSAVMFWCAVVFLIGTPLYLAKAFRCVYHGTSWHGAVWKALFINVLYLVFLLAASLLLLVLFILLNQGVYKH